MVQLIKEIGCRAGEAQNMKWSQINFETGAVVIEPEKGSNPRVQKISRELLGRIQTLPRTSEKIFGETAYNTMRTNLNHQRKVLAKKLGNPELLRLTFTSLRHFYGTMLYHKGKSLLEIQKIMGHKSYRSTINYINFEKVIFGEDKEWVCKIAESPEDRKRLIEDGFEFVEKVGNQSYYRKLKLC
jgi:integrase